ncbi:MAG: hypothetical protein MRK01_13925 [Candidatus Scalindua sp.]|nr:hypothetical protein [Candidatus Scalindua sp.]
MEHDELFKILLDKGLLALLAIVVGFYFNWLLQKRKARDEFLKEIAHLRVSAYQKLWLHTMSAKYWGDKNISDKQRRQLNLDLVKWYYDKGGAMFLSFNAIKDLNIAREVLCDTDKTPDDIRDAFSKLRTTIKVDCQIYTESEKGKQLPKPPKRDWLGNSS